MPDLAVLELRAISTQLETANRRLAEISRRSTTAERQTGRLERRFRTTNVASASLSATLGGMLRVLGPLTAGFTAIGAVVRSIQLAGRFEQTRVAMETLLESTTAAQRVLQDLEEFAARTPFQFQGLVESTRLMLALGFNASQATDAIKTLADATAALGGGQPLLDRIVLALGQIQAKGKLSGEEMRQLAEAGIPGFAIIAEALGVTIPEAMKMSERGAISAQFAIEALLDGITERFEGSAEALSRTILGLFSTLRDNVNVLLRQIGEELFDRFALAEVLQSSIELIQGLTQNGDRLRQAMRLLSIALTFVTARFTALLALRLVTAFFRPLIAAIRGATISMRAFGAAIATNAITLLATAIGVAAASWVGYTDAVETATRAQNDFSRSASGLRRDISAIRQAIAEQEDRLRELQALRAGELDMPALFDPEFFETENIRQLFDLPPRLRALFGLQERLGPGQFPTLEALNQEIDSTKDLLDELRSALENKVTATAFVEYNRELDVLSSRLDATNSGQEAWRRELALVQEQLPIAQSLFTRLSEVLPATDERLLSAARTVDFLRGRIEALNQQSEEAARVEGLRSFAEQFVADVRGEELAITPQQRRAQERALERLRRMEEDLAFERRIVALDERNRIVESEVRRFRETAQAAQVSGIDERVNAYREELSELLRLEQQWVSLQEVVDTFAQGVGAAFADAIFEIRKFSDAMEALFRDISRLFLQQSFSQAINEFLGAFRSQRAGGAGLFGSIAGAVTQIFSGAVTGGGAGTPTTRPFFPTDTTRDPFAGGGSPFSRGGAFDQGILKRFQLGAVLSSPTTFGFRGGLGIAGEAGPEAFLPLTRDPRSGELSVRAVPSGDEREPVVVQGPLIQVVTPDADSFRRSPRQISANLRDALSQVR